MIDAGINSGHNLPYGLFISKVLTLHQVVLTRETRVVCNRTNEIGKAILTCIGMKKNDDGWAFRDVQTQVRSKVEMFDYDENSMSFTPESEFERNIVNTFKRIFEKSLKLEKSLFRMENKVDKLIKNYVDSSSSIEVSDDDDKSSEEDFWMNPTQNRDELFDVDHWLITELPWKLQYTVELNRLRKN
ncbi:hypothetical protein LR48_Vigan07g207700 [Vigna angularis]|uniref:Uncharacterized protein n=1 Tax=Phaseolus angularis TaxID=3914 RepID=A0A0L9V010_PHAAN|nr:hypothetical protein LR48_Vigan07g207700 [Vigna angularis]